MKVRDLLKEIDKLCNEHGQSTVMESSVSADIAIIDTELKCVFSGDIVTIMGR